MKKKKGIYFFVYLPVAGRNEKKKDEIFFFGVGTDLGYCPIVL